MVDAPPYLNEQAESIEAAADPTHRRGASQWVLPVVLAAQFVIPLSISGTAIALPAIATDLGTSSTPLQMVVNGFNLAFALCVVLWGAISDRIGYRASFRLGAAVVAIAGAASAVAPSLLALDLARVVAGVGSAAVLTGSTAILSNYYAGAARAKAFAIFGAANGLGLALGPTISGGLISLAGWRGVFMVHAVVLCLALVGSILIPRMQHHRPQSHRLLDLSLLGNRSFVALCLVPVAGSIGFVTLVTYLPSALSGILGMGAGGSGLLMLAMTTPVVIGPILSARLIKVVERVTPMVIVFASLVCLVVGALGLLLLRPGSGFGVILLPMVLIGFGFGLPVGLVDGEALALVTAHASGTAAGIINFFRIGSEAIFVAIYGWSLASHQQPNSRFSDSGFGRGRQI